MFIDCYEPEIMWSNFKRIVLAKVNPHIPTFTIKSEYQPPWFDSECYAKCRKKINFTRFIRRKSQ